MDHEKNQKNNNVAIPAAIVIAGVIVAGAVWADKNPLRSQPLASGLGALETPVLKNVPVSIEWNGLGARLVTSGVLDKEKFLALYAGNERASAEKMLDPAVKQIEMNEQSAPAILNLLWAMGLGQRSSILDSGEMKNPGYGGAENFASTGGWTIAVGRAMDHYSRHSFITLTPAEEALVKKVTGGIYRPCCDNATDFPDCNHGMAMLGLMELLASQGATESRMYATALQANAYWFLSQYKTIAQFLASKGLPWDKVEPRAILNKDFSSASGFKAIVAASQPVAPSKGGGGCSV